MSDNQARRLLAELLDLLPLDRGEWLFTNGAVVTEARALLAAEPEAPLMSWEQAASADAVSLMSVFLADVGRHLTAEGEPPVFNLQQGDDVDRLAAILARFMVDDRARPSSGEGD